MILTVDLEKTFTQFIIIVFSLAFICITCWAKVKIEEMFRENAKKLKNMKTKVTKLKNQEIQLYRQAMFVSSNHHQRSIIAASFLQTCEEELARLQRISATIKQAQSPSCLPGLQHLSSHKLTNSTKVDTPVAFSATSANHVDGLEKKPIHKRDSKSGQLNLLQSNVLQSKAEIDTIHVHHVLELNKVATDSLSVTFPPCVIRHTAVMRCKTWEENIKKMRKIRHQWDSPYCKILVEKQLKHPSPFCEGCPLSVPNSEALYSYLYSEEDKSKNKSTSYEDIGSAEKKLRVKMLPMNPLVKTPSLYSVSHNDDNLPQCGIKKFESRGDICDSLLKERLDRKCHFNKTTQYNYSIQTYFDFEKKKCNLEKVFTASLSYKNIKSVFKKQCEDNVFVGLLFRSCDDRGSEKQVTRNTRSSTIYIGKRVNKGIKFIYKNTHVCLHRDKLLNNFKSYIFKMPIRMNNNKVILKFIFCVCIKYGSKSAQSIAEKRTRNLECYMTHMKRNTVICGRNTNSIIPVEYNHSMPQLKRLSLYTDSSTCSTVSEKARTEPAEYTPFVLGDNQFSLEALALNDINQPFYNYRSPLNCFSKPEVRDIIDRVILKEHIGLLGKHFKDCSDTYNAHLPEQINLLSCRKLALETINEESEDGLSDKVSDCCSETEEMEFQQITAMETNLSLSKVNYDVTLFTNDTRTIQNRRVFSSNLEDVISGEKDISKIMKTVDLDQILMSAMLDLGKSEQKLKSLTCNFYFQSFIKKFYVNTLNCLTNQGINNSTAGISMNASQEWIIIRQANIERLIPLGLRNLERISICYTDNDSDHYNCNKISSLRDAEDLMLTTSVVIEEVFSNDLVLGDEVDNCSQNSEIQYEENSPCSTNETALTESESSLCSSDVRNYIWCDKSSLPQCTEYEHFIPISNSGGWLLCSETFD